jgi:hypothetical protein
MKPEALWVTMSALGGAKIDDCVRDGLRVAKRLGIGVEFPFNGVTVYCRVTDHASDVIDAWEREITRQKFEQKAANAAKKGKRT